ncbi:hemolysin [gut metagenome]|uniref:Hemolysin n=1 Tax=gut metagenome TaxID=749906 RepID=J9CMT1_9ZZZZ
MGLIIIYFVGALSLSFLCSVLEAVLLSTPMSFISMKENQGNPTATLMKQYKNNVDRPVGAILSLNTIAHTIGSAGVGAESIKIFGEEYFGVISAVLTLLILVLSEIIPKTIGASYWRSLAMPSTQIIRVLIIITYPLVLLSELITKVFTPKGNTASMSREEVSAMVDVGTTEGVFRESESKIIKSCIHLSGVRAKEVMTPFIVVESANQHLTLKEFADQQTWNFSRIPVYDSSKEYITGYILKDKVLQELSDDHFQTRLSDLMRPILSFQEDESVYRIWEKMLEKREHISIIVDEYGCLRGVVSMEDVIETMTGVEIVDEDDVAVDMQALAKEKSLKMSQRRS